MSAIPAPGEQAADYAGATRRTAQGGRLGLALVVIASAQLMVVLDATIGIALLVYGLSRAATGPDGVSHWGDVLVLASLAAAAVLLVSFVLVELRSSYPLLPMGCSPTGTGPVPT